MEGRGGPALTTVAFLAAMALAACIQPGRQHVSAPESQSRSLTSTSSGTADNRFLEPIQPGGFLATNCTGWEVRQFWPGPEPPEPRIASWKRTNPGVGSVFMEGFECKRVAFGGLERGPVQMVLDYADNLDVPEECGKAGRSTDFFGLYSWGISDADLAQRLATTLAAPTYVIDYAWETEMPSNQAGSVEKVEWGPHGQPASSLHIDASQGAQPDARFPGRFYWANGTGVVALDAVYEGEMNDFGDRFAYGTLAPPMTLADAYATFASSSEWLRKESISGTVYSWSDLECKHPSGSSPPS